MISSRATIFGLCRRTRYFLFGCRITRYFPLMLLDWLEAISSDLLSDERTLILTGTAFPVLADLTVPSRTTTGLENCAKASIAPLKLKRDRTAISMAARLQLIIMDLDENGA